MTDQHYQKNGCKDNDMFYDRRERSKFFETYEDNTDTPKKAKGFTHTKDYF
jgi:hypothetical protein